LWQQTASLRISGNQLALASHRQADMKPLAIRIAGKQLSERGFQRVSACCVSPKVTGPSSGSPSSLLNPTNYVALNV
jgi:hypothetical protein